MFGMVLILPKIIGDIPKAFLRNITAIVEGLYTQQKYLRCKYIK